MKSSLQKRATAAKKGFTLLFGVLITGLLLSTVLTVAGIVVRQIVISGVGRESQIAFYAADSGLECVKSYDYEGWFDVDNDNYLHDIECNDQEFHLEGTVTTEQCSTSFTTTEYCPEPDDLIGQTGGDSYRMIRYASAALTSNDNSPEMEFVLLKRATDSRSTLTVSGRNTDSPTAGRRVERTLKETYLPDFQCVSPADANDPYSGPYSDIHIEAWRVSCKNEEDLPDWSNAWPPVTGYSLSYNDIQTFIAQSQGNCSLKKNACFEYNFEELDNDEDVDFGADFFNLGYNLPNGDYIGSVNAFFGNKNWIQFDNASTVLGPARATIRAAEDGNYIAKLRVRTHLQDGEYPFNQGPYPDPNNHEPGLDGSELICHQDGTNFDNVEYIGERRSDDKFNSPGAGTYTCVAFTANEE